MRVLTRRSQKRTPASYISLTLLAIVLALTTTADTSANVAELETALDRYIAAHDTAYGYEVVGEPVTSGLYSVITLRLNSQQWQGHTWSHNVTIYRPLLSRKSGPVTIMVDGGAKPSKDLEALSAIATATQTPVVILGSIPNQPLYGLKEDALIAYTFRRFIETGDETWPLLLPMTKSVVACMDALDSYFASEGRFSPEGYVIAGASKRGWTSWLTAAVDPRVIGIIPLVYDNLNLAAQLQNHLSMWGEYSPMIHDYTDLSIPQYLSTPAGSQLAQVVDPYSYLDRMLMPKLVVIGSNDPYWPLGSVNLYFDELKGDNYLLIMPNTGHAAGDTTRLFAGVTAFLLHVSGRLELPDLSWSFSVDEEQGVMRVTVNAASDATVSLWQATSDSTDFRQSKWTQVTGAAPGSTAEFELDLPETGRQAVFADITVKLPGVSATFTTTPFIY